MTWSWCLVNRTCPFVRLVKASGDVLLKNVFFVMIRYRVFVLFRGIRISVYILILELLCCNGRAFVLKPIQISAPNTQGTASELYEEVRFRLLGGSDSKGSWEPGPPHFFLLMFFKRCITHQNHGRSLGSRVHFCFLLGPLSLAQKSSFDPVCSYIVFLWFWLIYPSSESTLSFSEKSKIHLFSLNRIVQFLKFWIYIPSWCNNSIGIWVYNSFALEWYLRSILCYNAVIIP